MLKKIPLLLFCLPFLLPADTPAKYQRKYPRTMIFSRGQYHYNPGPFFYFPEKFSPPQTGEFFESQKEEHFHFSKNSPGETGTSFCLKKEFEHRENGRKEIRTSGLYT